MDFSCRKLRGMKMAAVSHTVCPDHFKFLFSHYWTVQPVACCVRALLLTLLDCATSCMLCQSPPVHTTALSNQLHVVSEPSFSHYCTVQPVACCVRALLLTLLDCTTSCMLCHYKQSKTNGAGNSNHINNK